MAGAVSSSYYAPGQPGNQNWLSQGPHGDEWVNPNGYINTWDPTHQTYLNTGRQDAGYLQNQHYQQEASRQAGIDAENSRRTAAHDAALDALRAQISAAYSGPGAYIGAGGGMPEDHSSYDNSADRNSMDASYAGAKDKVGVQNQSNLRALRDQLSRRGLTGSGLEGRGTADVLRGGGADLTSVLRQQVQDQTNNQREFYTDQRQGNRQIGMANMNLAEQAREADMADRRQRLSSLFQMSASY
jgi:hypothetical protein